MTDGPQLTKQQCATLACLLEVTAPKPGNVHRGADFEDTTFVDFAASAVAIGPSMQDAHENPVGHTVLHAVQATRRVTRANTNLGIVLLLAPLAKVIEPAKRRAELRHILSSLEPGDARDVYEAIALCKPGGLGRVEEMDVHQSAPTDLAVAMASAASRDMIARQYVSNFELVLDQVAPRLAEACGRYGPTLGIIDTHVWLMAHFPDSLILRKCGIEVANQASALAQTTLDSGNPESEDYRKSLGNLDFWLRGDGNRRNPGTTADLIAAGLFVCLQDRESVVISADLRHL